MNVYNVYYHIYRGDYHTIIAHHSLQPGLTDNILESLVLFPIKGNPPQPPPLCGVVIVMMSYDA